LTTLNCAWFGAIERLRPANSLLPKSSNSTSAIMS